MMAATGDEIEIVLLVERPLTVPKLRKALEDELEHLEKADD